MATGTKLGFSFRPRVFESLQNYSAQKFFGDLTAGITVGLVALPLAMAFGIASGVKPESGIATAIVAGFLISALGGSRVQIGGPTGAFVVIVLGILNEYGLDNLLICTFIAGILLLAMGFFRLGALIKYIPYPLITGFTSGIAILIVSTQIKDFFGLQTADLPADFLNKIRILLLAAPTFQGQTLTLAVGSVLLLFLWPKKLGRYLPASIVVIVLGSVLVAACQLPMETIGSKFGEMPQSLPPFHKFSVAVFSWTNIHHLLRPALTIALLAAIESLLCAVVADGMIDDRHDSNQELMATGIANIFCPLWGGIPATGAIARTATNVKNGGRSPVAGIIHALTLLALVLLAAPLAKYIPLASLSAVLVLVAWNMGEWHNFTRLARWPKGDATVFLVVFALTVLIDLTFALEIGMVVAAVFLIKRLSDQTQVHALDESHETESPQNSLRGKELPNGVMVFRIYGTFFFGAVDKLESALARTRQDPEVLILKMREVLAMDASGLNALENIHHRLQARGKSLILSGAHTQPLMAMIRAGFIERLGDDNVCEDLDSSLVRARVLLAKMSKIHAPILHGEHSPAQP